MRGETNMQHGISLLWPYRKKQNSSGAIINESAAKDIGITSVFERYSEICGPQFKLNWSALAGYMTDDCETIAYRLDIVDDLLSSPELCGRLEECIGNFGGRSALTGNGSGMQYIEQVQYELGRIKIYVETIDALYACLHVEGIHLASKGLTMLRELISGIHSQKSFQNLRKNLPLLSNVCAKPASITVGVNLNDFFSPEAVVLQSLNNFRYDPPITLIERIMYKFGIRSMFNALRFLQITKRKYDSRLLRKCEKYNEFAVRTGGIKVKLSVWQKECLKYDKKMIMEVEGICNRLYNQLSTEIYMSMRNELNTINSICEDLNLLLSYVNFIKELRSAGIKMCKPEVLPVEKRACMIKDICNLNLVYSIREQCKNGNISTAITFNDVSFEDGKPVVITGPNRGGKTTYIQAVGQAQVLFQLGLYVPGSRAEMSPVDGIYTHFPAEEEMTVYKGRLGEECKRMADIFKKATANSLIIINETFSSTSGGEGLEIGRNVLKGLKMLGAHCLYATHIHGLADGSDVVSLVAGADIKYDDKGNEHIKLTHKISRMPSDGKSYAKSIAKQYGIDLNSIMKKRADV